MSRGDIDKEIDEGLQYVVDKYMSRADDEPGLLWITSLTRRELKILDKIGNSELNGAATARALKKKFPELRESPELLNEVYALARRVATDIVEQVPSFQDQIEFGKKGFENNFLVSTDDREIAYDARNLFFSNFVPLFVQEYESPSTDDSDLDPFEELEMLDARR